METISNTTNGNLNHTASTVDYSTESTVLTTNILQEGISVSGFQENATYPVTPFPTTVTFDYANSSVHGNSSDYSGIYGNSSDHGNSSDYGNYDNGDYFDSYDYGNSSDYINSSGFPDYYEDEYMYPGFSFERPVYLVLWEFLVIFTSLVNIIVIYVLLQRKMRNSTNIILSAIAISDSLTGLVTLPSYIMVFQRFDPHVTYSGFPANQSGPDANQSKPPGLHYIWYLRQRTFPPAGGNLQEHLKTDFLPSSVDLYSKSKDQGYPNSISVLPSRNELNSSSPNVDQLAYYAYGSGLIANSTPGLEFSTPPATHKPLDGYTLTKNLCRGFMISKYFLSKWLHTISIFLTLFLGIQRFICVAYPFKSQSMFSVTKTFVCCLVIFIVSHILHVYHLSDEKATDGQCQWELNETGCKGGCIYLWMMFFIRHFIPCMALIIFTGLFIRELNKGERNLRRTNSTISQVSRRADENRRITIIVVAVVIVFLIPEVPYGVFLLYNAIAKTYNNGEDIDLETNRAIHMVYELLLVVSFHANFYIYTQFNRRFRKSLIRTFIHPFGRFFGDQRRFLVSRTSSLQRPSTRKTDFTMSTVHELKELNTLDRNNPSVMDKQILESFIPISTKRESGDNNENMETKFTESASAETTQHQEEANNKPRLSADL